jgi:hypothetical protein
VFVFLGGVFFSNNLNPIGPILFPTLLVKAEEFWQGVEFGHLQIPIELLQGFMNPGTHKSFNPLCFDLNLVNIGEFVLVRAGFIGRKLRMRVGRHPSPPLYLILVFFRKSFASSAPPEDGAKGNLRLFLTRKRDSVKRGKV